MNSGHVKQVAAFEQLVGYCSTQGAMFNPSRMSIQPAALSALLTSAQLSLEVVRTALTEYRSAVNTRRDTFDELPKFMTRMVNALSASEASRATVQEAYRFIKKFYRSFRAKRTNASSGESSEVAVTRSVSELDFDSRTSNFEGLLKVLSMEPSYHPNEPELQVASLLALASHLRGLNTAVMNAQIVLSNARASRNKLLYERTGIHGTAQSVKQYVKAAYGYESVAYNQIGGIRFLIRRNF